MDLISLIVGESKKSIRKDFGFLANSFSLNSGFLFSFFKSTAA